MGAEKIGVISIWDIDNYGNRLQNYAMVTAVRELGYDAYTLKMWPQSGWKRVFQYVTNFDVSRFRICIEKFLGHSRKANFLRFERNHICKDRHFFDSEADAAYLNQTYHKYVLGSDQIWNPVFLKQYYYFGSFTQSPNYAFSYAASMGVSEMDKSAEDLFSQNLDTVKYISVREDKAADYIEKLKGTRPQVVLDPTMLLSVSHWEQLETKPDYIKGDYIVLYYLGDLSEARLQALQKLCADNHYDMIILGKPEYRDYYTAGPAEFLYLIHHAKLMCTDSFHGCVFSILYHTPFYVFERENSVQQMNSRLDTLLNTFRLTDRMIRNENPELTTECDFSHCEEILARRREESVQFLQKSLEDRA